MRTRRACSSSPWSMAPLADESVGLALGGGRAQTNRWCHGVGLGYNLRKVVDERASLRVPPTRELAVEQAVQRVACDIPDTPGDDLETSYRERRVGIDQDHLGVARQHGGRRHQADGERSDASGVWTDQNVVRRICQSRQIESAQL